MTASPLSSRLLISHITLRGPELRQIYAIIVAKPNVHYQDLAVALGVGLAHSEANDLDDAPLREALSFLIGVGLIEQHGASRRRATFCATPIGSISTLPFEILLAQHIRKHPDPRQRAISLVHAALVDDDVLATSPTALRERMERGSHRALFTWTGEKIVLWCHLASFIGIIHRPQRENTMLIVPQPNLIRAALAWAYAQTSTTAITALLHAIDTELFACTTARGRIHRGLAQTLLALESEGHLHLIQRADSVRSMLLGERRVSDLMLTTKGTP